MNGPQARRQGPQLNAFHTALFDEGDRILKIIVRILSAIGSEDSAGGHRLAVNRFDYAQFVRTDFDQRDFLAEEPFGERVEKVQTRFEDIRLNTNLAFRR